MSIPFCLTLDTADKTHEVEVPDNLMLTLSSAVLIAGDSKSDAAFVVMSQTMGLDPSDGAVEFPLCVLRPKVCENASLNMQITSHRDMEVTLKGGAAGGKVYLYGYFQQEGPDGDSQDSESDMDEEEMEAAYEKMMKEQGLNGMQGMVEQDDDDDDDDEDDEPPALVTAPKAAPAKPQAKAAKPVKGKSQTPAAKVPQTQASPKAQTVTTAPTQAQAGSNKRPAAGAPTPSSGGKESGSNKKHKKRKVDRAQNQA